MPFDYIHTPIRRAVIDTYDFKIAISLRLYAIETFFKISLIIVYDYGYCH